METLIQKITRIFKNSGSFLITTHVNPDGDAIGSMAAAGFLLQALDKDVTIYSPACIPERYAWLPFPCAVKTCLPNVLPEWILALDCSSPQRLDETLLFRLDKTRTINIDHHGDNLLFGAINWVDAKEPAVGNMIAKLAHEASVPLTGGIAEAVYLAVATDTGQFTYDNTTPETLELTAKLLRQGLPLGRINKDIYNQWSLNRMRLWQRVLSNLELRHKGLLAWAVITYEDFRDTCTTSEDCDEFITFFRRIRGVRICALLRQESSTCWKISLRSQASDNVQSIASLFGGGGHKNASGALAEGSLRDILNRLEQAVGQMLDLEASE